MIRFIALFMFCSINLFSQDEFVRKNGLMYDSNKHPYGKNVIITYDKFFKNYKISFTNSDGKKQIWEYKKSDKSSNYIHVGHGNVAFVRISDEGIKDYKGGKQIMIFESYTDKPSFIIEFPKK